MALRFSTRRILMMVGCVAVTAMLGGCFGTKQVAFTNVSDSWLNVRFFVANPDMPVEMQEGQTEAPTTPNTTPEFVAHGKLQVPPGETAKYSLSRNPNYAGTSENKVVHIQVEPVTPSWQPSGTQYWLEMLTPPPVTIVATGTSKQLMFNSGTGAVAQIPEREIKQGRFEHRVVTVNESSAPQSH